MCVVQVSAGGSGGGGFGTPVKVKGWKPEMVTGCSVHSQVFGGKSAKAPEETQWRSMEDTQADRQFNGSSEQISHPHTNQTRVHSY